MKPIKIYFAGPLFSESERKWVESVIERLYALVVKLDIPVEIIWPWELFGPGELDALGDQAQQEVFKRCREHLDSSDMVIALLDGALVDDGTVWEIGYYYTVRPDGALIIGVRTDGRRASEFSNSRVNCMIECSCDRIAGPFHHGVGLQRQMLA